MKEPFVLPASMLSGDTFPPASYRVVSRMGMLRSMIAL